MGEGPSTARAITLARDATTAADELAGALLIQGCCLVLVFVSPGRDLEALGSALAARFGAVPVIGCTTAGEIGPGGYAENSIVGVSFAAPEFAAAFTLIPALRSAHRSDIEAAVRQVRLAITDFAPWARHENLFAITLIDGVSGCEEVVAAAASVALAGVPIGGGSAGDGLDFRRSFILCEGQFHAEGALICVFATRRRFRAFKTEHFVAGEEKVVVTGADPRRRVVTEMNAEPAAREYARIAGLTDPAELTPAVFATHPMVVRIGGQNFVRAVQRANADGSLTFLCAIDEGVVLTVAQGVDLLRNLEQTFAWLAEQLGPPSLVITFDCILRGFELDLTQSRRAVAELIDRNNGAGFCTYGEQFDAMHINQTLTGIAIGARHA